MGPLLRDAAWVRQSFLVRKEALENVDSQNRFFSSASLKFVDTAPGGSFAINPPPQFTRAADPPVQGRNPGSQGLGRYYSEAIDDHSQIISMRFGVPQFNSMTTFFTGFYNTGAGQLARTGRATSAFYYLGRAAGFVISVMSWKLLAVHLLGVGLKFMMQKPTSKYYYLKPAMPLYWNAVQTIVNHIAVNSGVVPRIGGDTQKAVTGEYEFDQAGLANLHKALPDVFKEGGGIDVYALANRAQRLARKHYKQWESTNDSATNMNLTTSMDDYSRMVQNAAGGPLTDQKPDYQSYMDKWLDAQPSKPKESDDGNGVEKIAEKEEDKESQNAGFLDFLQAELDDGAAFANFRVNYTGSVSESFSNSVGESEIAQKINSMSSSARSTSFNLAGGNIDDGVVGKTIGAVLGAAKDVATGVMDQMGVSGLAMLGGAAFVDIPKHWQSSSASLPRMNYTIQLVSPYGNPISRLINLHLPLAMLLAGALPLSTGKQSYTSPFLVEVYDQGRCQTRLGMIDSLSITRGVGNLGFNADNQCLAIDVSFSIVDMSSVLHMPISEGISLTNVAAGAVAGGLAGGAAGAAAGAAVASGVFDDDTVFSDYMAVLGGMGLADQIYSIRKLKLNLTRKLADFERWTSPAFYASFVGDTPPARLISAFYKGVDRGSR